MRYIGSAEWRIRRPRVPFFWTSSHPKGSCVTWNVFSCLRKECGVQDAEEHVRHTRPNGATISRRRGCSPFSSPGGPVSFPEFLYIARLAQEKGEWEHCSTIHRLQPSNTQPSRWCGWDSQKTSTDGPGANGFANSRHLGMKTSYCTSSCTSTTTATLYPPDFARAPLCRARVHCNNNYKQFKKMLHGRLRPWEDYGSGSAIYQARTCDHKLMREFFSIHQGTRDRAVRPTSLPSTA